MGNQLVDDAVEFLLCEEVIVPVEENGYIVVDHKRVDWLIPSGSVFIEAPGVIAIVASHFKEGNPFDSAASLRISTDELMAENELEDCAAIRNGLLEPMVLLLAQCPIPTIRFFANLALGVPRACPVRRFFGLAVIFWAVLDCGIVVFVHIECQFESVFADSVAVDSDFLRPRGKVSTKSGLRIIRGISKSS